MKRCLKEWVATCMRCHFQGREDEGRTADITRALARAIG